MSDAVARAEVEKAWGAALPTEAGPGHQRASWPPPAAGQLAGLLIGGVDIDDLPDPAAALAALAKAGLRGQPGARAGPPSPSWPTWSSRWPPHAEKSGSYLNWEGRIRPFDAALAESAGWTTAGCWTPSASRWTSTCYTQTPLVGARRPRPARPVVGHSDP